MTVLTVVIWKWRQVGHPTVYTARHVNAFAEAFRRHHRGAHRIVCVTDDPRGVQACETFPLWPDYKSLRNPNGLKLPSCYRRLKLFDATTAAALGIKLGDPVLSSDIDVVITGELTDFIAKYARYDFAGWKRIWVPGARGPRQPPSYNGSLTLHRAGRVQELWDEFDPRYTPKLTHDAGYYGSDQAWISYRLQGRAPGWTQADGVFSYASDVVGRPLPINARLVFFNGRHKPWDAVVQRASPWVGEYWR